MSPRLKAVAGAIPAAAAVADVGSGDGQLSAWLVAQNPTRRVIAVELQQGPLRRLRERLGCTGVETRHGDGLNTLRPGEVDVAVVAGMGGRRIARLIEGAPEVVDSLSLLVLQPVQHADELKRRLAAEGRPFVEQASPVQSGRAYTVLIVGGSAGARG